MSDKYNEALKHVYESNRVSISGIQRKLRIGYNEAARYVERMESEGVVTEPNQKGQRSVLMPY